MHYYLIGYHKTYLNIITIQNECYDVNIISFRLCFDVLFSSMMEKHKQSHLGLAELYIKFNSIFSFHIIL